MGLLLSCFLLAAAGSHAVFDFIPAVFLGAPTEDTALATLPGHRLLLVGQGAKAVALAARGALLGTAFAVVALIPLRFLLADPVNLADRFRPWAPAFVVCVLGAVLASGLRGRARPPRDGVRRRCLAPVAVSPRGSGQPGGSIPAVAPRVRRVRLGRDPRIRTSRTGSPSSGRLRGLGPSPRGPVGRCDPPRHDADRPGHRLVPAVLRALRDPHVAHRNPGPSGTDSLSAAGAPSGRSEEHTSELQSPMYLVCRLL